MTLLRWNNKDAAGCYRAVTAQCASTYARASHRYWRGEAAETSVSRGTRAIRAKVTKARSKARAIPAAAPLAHEACTAAAHRRGKRMLKFAQRVVCACLTFRGHPHRLTTSSSPATSTAVSRDPVVDDHETDDLAVLLDHPIKRAYRRVSHQPSPAGRSPGAGNAVR